MLNNITCFQLTRLAWRWAQLTFAIKLFFPESSQMQNMHSQFLVGLLCTLLVLTLAR